MIDCVGVNSSGTVFMYGRKGFSFWNCRNSAYQSRFASEPLFCCCNLQWSHLTREHPWSSRRSSLCCSCASCVSARSFSTRSWSRVFGFVIVIDLLFDFGDKKRPSTFRTVRPVNSLIFDVHFLCSVRQNRSCHFVVVTSVAKILLQKLRVPLLYAAWLIS